MEFSSAAALLVFFCLLLQPQEIDGRLIITLEEPDGTPMNNVLVRVSESTANQSRRINLVSGRTYHLHCEAGSVESSRSSSLEAVWFSGGNEVTVGSASDPNHPMRYTYLDRDRQTLVLTNFMGAYVGEYRCRERGTGNKEGAAVVIGIKNPVVIAASEPVVLSEGDQDNSRPVLVALVSGTPYPQRSNISWRFNNSRSLPGGVVEHGHELLLPVNIRPDIEGVYTCTVTTSAGSDSANISVRLIRQPSVSLSPTNSHSVQVNSSVTLVCNDSRGLPPPTFMWTYNGSNLTTGDHISRVDQRASAPYRSSLTIDHFQPRHRGEYKCTASNDAGSSHRAVTLSVQQPSPPAPPTSIQVTPLTACSISIEWTWPQITDDNNNIMAPPDYVMFEVNLIGESDWTEIGTADITQTSLVVRTPGKSVNAEFRLRSRCVSNSRGAGDYFNATSTFTAYSEATLSRLLSLSTRVLSSSEIQISWTLPEQDCFNFTAFTVTCHSATQASTMRIVLVTMATITGLNPDTSYNCSVTTQLRESLRGEFFAQVTTYATQLTTTYSEFSVFQLVLTGISNCEEWIKETAAAKRDAVTMAIVAGIEELCQCGFTTNTIQASELQCFVPSKTAVIYQAEVHSMSQVSLPRLLSLFQEWIRREPQLLINSQPVRVDSNCSAVPVFLNDKVCEKLKVDSQHTEMTVSIYAIIGITIGLALILILSVAIVTMYCFVSRHRKTLKLNSSRDETKQEADVPCSASNPAAVTGVNIETVEYPHYEQVDLADGEPQYESLNDYDKLPSSGTDKLCQLKHADCPVYEPTIMGNS